MSRKTRVGDYIRTIPEVQASNMALRAQLADNLSFMKKAQNYNNGSIMASVTSSIAPAVCKVLNPPLNKTDFQKHTTAKLNQYILKKVLAEFKAFDKGSFYNMVSNDKAPKTLLEKTLKFWWGWAGKDVISKVKTAMLQEAAAPNFKDNIPYTDLSATKDQYEKYRLLLAAV